MEGLLHGTGPIYIIKEDSAKNVYCYDAQEKFVTMCEP